MEAVFVAFEFIFHIFFIAFLVGVRGDFGIVENGVLELVWKS